MDKLKACEKIVNYSAVISGVCALNPIPGMDTALITLVQTVMITNISAKMGTPISATEAFGRAVANVSDNPGKYLFNEVTNMAPVGGNIPNMLMSFYITKSLGYEMIRQYCNR